MQILDKFGNLSVAILKGETLMYRMTNLRLDSRVYQILVILTKAVADGGGKMMLENLPELEQSPLFKKKRYNKTLKHLRYYTEKFFLPIKKKLTKLKFCQKFAKRLEKISKSKRGQEKYVLGMLVWALRSWESREPRPCEVPGILRREEREKKRARAKIPTLEQFRAKFFSDPQDMESLILREYYARYDSGR